ncbi:MAG: DUF2993 domain-containing protein [Elainellaceae cyanobacterium]
MLGGLTGLGNQTGGDFGERMLNTVASQSIRHLFTSSESVDVAIRCSPSSKLLQGSVDSFKMSGRRLVIRRDFKVDEMSFETDSVAIDVRAMLAGKLQLRQPTQAVAQVVLTEDAINQAFEAELVKQRMQQVDLESLTNLSGGEPVSFRDVKVMLRPNNGVTILAKTDLPNKKDVPVSLQATLAVEKRRRVLFQNAEFVGDVVPNDIQGLSKIVSEAFADILNGMVDLDRFDLDGVLMRINRLETRGKQLLFSGYAQIEKVPNS